MQFKTKEHKDDLLFVPLGGCNEIGMNLNLYHVNGKWIIVDCGSGFPDDYYPGIDLIVADISFVVENAKDILGVILTHAHEDHVGGLGFLLQEVDIPVYTTKFTANFIKNKLSEFRFEKKPKINVVEPKSKIELGPFEIEFASLTHSAPEMQALMIRTDKGNIFHTGDWKFDHDPVIGETNDEELLSSYGKEGVTALVCDSTNVFSKGKSGSEGDLRKSLTDIIAGCPKMVVVTTFASNLARLDTVLEAAKLAGRKVALSGRSMHRILAAARDSGYLQNLPHLIDEKAVGKYSRKEVLILATGCQGEPMAATAKMAGKNHPHYKLAPGDTVIFSSKIIPGNEKKIFRMFNMFVRDGIEVITEKDHFVHVSGHPNIDELKKMHDLIRPKIVVPVHGEPVHIHEHSKLATSWGNAKTLEPENGSVVRLDPNDPKIISMVDSGYFAVDGNFLLPPDSGILKTRRRIREAGIIIATICVDKKGKLVVDPVISAPASLDDIEDKEIISFMVQEVTEAIENLISREGGNYSKDQMEVLVKSTIRRIIKEESGKQPQIIVNLAQAK